MFSSQPITMPPPPFNALNPYPWFAWMRQHERVCQDPSTVWYLFCYQDVLRALNPPLRPTPQDPLVFSSAMPIVPGAPRIATQGSIIFTDPPRQRAVREILNATFAPKTLQDRYASQILSIIDELIDELIDTQLADIVPLAYAIPVLVITELLGVPRSDRPQFQQWANQVVGRAAVEEAAVVIHLPELEQYFLHAIEQRYQQPEGEHPDLITTLVHGCPADGVPLSHDEIVGNCELLLLAGFETTAHLLTNLFRVLDAFPDVQEQVWQNPNLIPAFIEETLRYLSPAHIQTRYTTREVEIGGKVIPANQVVFPLLTSANRDEQVFVNPDSFDLLRFARAAPNHVAFGFRGTHFCLGAPLARLEATLVMQRLIAHMEQIRAVAGVALQPLAGSSGTVPLVNGLQAFPVTFKRR